VKIHDLFIQQALEFNMNYRALSGYCKSSEYMITNFEIINPEYRVFTVLFRIK